MATGSLAASVRAWAGQPDFGITAETAALLLLNLLDGIFTLVFLQLGVAQELNPVMRVAYEAGPLVFMMVKVGVVALGVLVLMAHRQYRFARAALTGGAFLYAAIVVYHLAFLTWVATS
jgi:hypothetical protein